MWRAASPSDDDAIVAMSLALYEEDPSPEPVPEAHIRRTLGALREAPSRGCALVLEQGGRVCGYALLISFWSNELGGEICTIDELYVERPLRSRGLASKLVEELRAGAGAWGRRPIALELEVSPDNHRARRLYERLGFRIKRNSTYRAR